MPLPLPLPFRLRPARALGKTEMDALRALWAREGFELWRELTAWMTVWASGPSYGRIVAGGPLGGERIAGG